MDTCIWCVDGFTVTDVLCKQCGGFGVKAHYVNTVVQSMYDDPERLACSVAHGYVSDRLEIQDYIGIASLMRAVNLDKVHSAGAIIVLLTSTRSVAGSIPGREDYYNRAAKRLNSMGKDSILRDLQ